MGGATRIDSTTQAGVRKGVVLIVSDSDDLTAHVQSQLPDLEHSVVRTREGALGKLRACRPVLAVIDMNSMRDVPALIRQMRSHVNGATCRILVLPTDAQQADCIESLLSGADDYLPQPFSDEDFVVRSKLLLRLGETLGQLAAQSAYSRNVVGRGSGLAANSDMDLIATAIQTVTEIAEVAAHKAERTFDKDTKESLYEVRDSAQRLIQLIERNL